MPDTVCQFNGPPSTARNIIYISIVRISPLDGISCAYNHMPLVRYKVRSPRRQDDVCIAWCVASEEVINFQQITELVHIMRSVGE